jgi:cell division protein FtsI/penicillin-binding protein 2
VKPPEQWSDSDQAIIPFGQAIAVTPLQMATAVAAIANNGVLIKPTIIRRILDAEGHQLKDYTANSRGKRVISEETARLMQEMMRGVVDEGTGAAARIYGYAVGGKTGTSQKIDTVNGGYMPGQYISSFAGILTVNNPRLAILVVIDTPRGQYYGGDVAAPVFKNIAEEAIRYLAIPPDKK